MAPDAPAGVAVHGVAIACTSPVSVQEVLVSACTRYPNDDEAFEYSRSTAWVTVPESPSGSNLIHVIRWPVSARSSVQVPKFDVGSFALTNVSATAGKAVSVETEPPPPPAGV